MATLVYSFISVNLQDISCTCHCLLIFCTIKPNSYKCYNYFAMERKVNNHGLKGLLHLAVEQSAPENQNMSTAYGEMSTEEKTFVENALKSMTVDIIGQFKAAITVLENSSSNSEDKLNALQLIRENIDNIDFANSFVKVGGTATLLDHLHSDDCKVKAMTIYIIAEMSQNNLFCQNHFLNAKVITLLVSYLKEGEEIASSALYAVSSLIRNFEPGMVDFMQMEGTKHILSCLDICHPRVFVKSCFLLGNLCSEYPIIRDELLKYSTFEKLYKHVEPVYGFNVKLESVLFALAELSKSQVWLPDAEMKSNISDVMNDVINRNKHLPECEEIVAYASVVLQNL